MSSSGGTGTFIKSLLSIHYESSINTILCCDMYDANESMQKSIFETNTELIKLKKKKKIFNKSYFSLIFEWLHYFPIIKKYKPELVVISTANPGWCFSFLFLKVPCIYILHTPVQRSTFKNKLMFSIPRYLSKNSKIFYSVSNYVKNSIINNWGVDEKFIHTIYNSYKIYPKINSNTINKNDKKIILTLGHVVNYKNPNLWIEIAEKITFLNDEVEFYWLGQGDLLVECQEKTKNNSRIHFLGHIENVEDYYKNAYLYLQPSIKESLGMSVIDAMYFSLPCIVSDAEGLPETIEDAISGFVIRSDNANNYVDKIQLLLNDVSKSVFLGKNANLKANKIFQPAIQKQTILNLYKKVTNNIYNFN
jgi:glycosyltransferase involved in cell wall biosynthesis